MNWLRCWSTKNVLDLYTDGRLTEAAAAKVYAHLESCPSCREAARELSPVTEVLPPSEVRVPEGLAEAILRRYAEESSAPSPIPWEGLRLTPARAAALAYLLLLAGAHALPGVPSQSYSPASPRTADVSARPEAPR